MCLEVLGELLRQQRDALRVWEIVTTIRKSMEFTSNIEMWDERLRYSVFMVWVAIFFLFCFQISAWLVVLIFVGAISFACADVCLFCMCWIYFLLLCIVISFFSPLLYSSYWIENFTLGCYMPICIFCYVWVGIGFGGMLLHFIFFGAYILELFLLLLDFYLLRYHYIVVICICWFAMGEKKRNLSFAKM